MQTRFQEPDMRAQQRPPTAGIVSCLCYLLAVFAPYVLLEGPELDGLAVYYNQFGIAGPQFLAALALVGIVLFAAGREARTQPDYAAGLTLVLGVVLTLFAFGWALAVPEDVVLSIGEATWLEYHRWVVVAAGAAIAASSAWYARTLGLV